MGGANAIVARTNFRAEIYARDKAVHDTKPERFAGSFGRGLKSTKIPEEALKRVIRSR